MSDIRFYVLETRPEPWLAPYIIAEVPAIPDEDEPYRRDLARAAGDRFCHVLNRMEIQAVPGGRVALEAWEAGDDSAWYEANRFLIDRARAEDEADGLPWDS